MFGRKNGYKAQPFNPVNKKSNRCLFAPFSYYYFRYSYSWRACRCYFTS